MLKNHGVIQPFANLNKHTTQEGLREIIRDERLIELSFEGNRYNDLRRWKLAEEYFNSPVFGGL